MANVIQIKHGTSKPVNGTLKSFELGFDEISKKLYIGDKNEVPILLTPEIPKIPTIENQTIKPANIIIKENQHYKNGASGINLQNSDIIGINGLYLNQTDSSYEGAGIFFQSGDRWNRLYESGGELYYRKDVTKEEGVNPQNLAYKIHHSGLTDLSISHIDFTKNQWIQEEKSAINLNNSDIIGANGIYFQDTANAEGEGLFFRRTDEKDEWDRLYSYNGQLYYAPQVTMTTGNDAAKDGKPTSHKVYHSGMTTAIPITNGGTGATTVEGILTNLGINTTKLEYLSNVRSDIQQQIDSSQWYVTHYSRKVEGNKSVSLQCTGEPQVVIVNARTKNTEVSINKQAQVVTAIWHKDMFGEVLSPYGYINDTLSEWPTLVEYSSEQGGIITITRQGTISLKYDIIIFSSASVG